MDLEGLNGKALLSLSYKFHPSHETKDGKIFPRSQNYKFFMVFMKFGFQARKT